MRLSANFDTEGLPPSTLDCQDEFAMSDQEQVPDRTRETIGPYRILEPLGEGGMGTVYLAEQRHPVRRRVALKLIKLGMDTKLVLARFEAERQALAMMEHDNVAKVFDAGKTDDGRPFFVMECVKGASLADYCDQNRLSIPSRLRLMESVCAGVQHAHEKGIIHRDLKPGNVLVTTQSGKPVPKIIDFGLARATDHRLVQQTLHTEQGQILGTPAYMSPEQAGLGSADIDSRTDIYSLGVLLYEMLTGQLPLANRELCRGGFFEMQRKIREEEPPKPSTRVSTRNADSEVAAKLRRMDLRTLCRGLRGDLDWITMKAIDKDRCRRYETAAQLSQDLRRYLTHQPVMAGPASLTYRLRRFMRRKRTELIVAAVLLVGVATAAWSMVLHLENAGLAAERDQTRDRIRKLLRSASDRQGQLEEMRSDWNRRGSQLTEKAERLKRELRGSATADAELRRQLEETEHELGRRTPLTASNSDLPGIREIARAAVLVEVRQTFVDRETNVPLYVHLIDGKLEPNFSRLGGRYANENSGSGVCISSEGWILTAASVVLRKRSTSAPPVGDSSQLRSRIDVNVAFSTGKRRHAATIHDVAIEGKQDIALLKIDPVERMPYLPVFDSIDLLPAPGSEAFVVGFPFGRRVMQEGGVPVSTILSSIVLDSGPPLRFHTGQHPGIFGGAVIDARGRVVGVLASSPSGEVTTFVHAPEIWPPRK